MFVYVPLKRPPPKPKNVSFNPESAVPSVQIRSKLDTGAMNEELALIAALKFASSQISGTSHGVVPLIIAFNVIGVLLTAKCHPGPSKSGSSHELIVKVLATVSIVPWSSLTVLEPDVQTISTNTRLAWHEDDANAAARKIS